MKTTYLPWSKSVLDYCLNAHKNSLLPTLDLELTAKCSRASCIYCDSSSFVGDKVQENEISFKDLKKVITEGNKLGLKWIYTCGLGEPLEDKKFKKMVELSSKFGIRISLFTNGLFITKEKAAWLHKNGVCLILKLDTLNENRFNKILGKNNSAKNVYRALKDLLDAGYGQNVGDGLTDLAVSIVPTTINYNDILEVVDYCFKNNIYPSVGELEYAGKASKDEVYSKLMPTAEEIKSLKQKLDDLIWKDYERPVCPSVITGVHIDFKGNYVIDINTGLNCKWFMLTDPTIIEIGHISTSNLKEILNTIHISRELCLLHNKKNIDEAEKVNFLFGGCGGSPQKLIKLLKEYK